MKIQHLISDLHSKQTIEKKQAASDTVKSILDRCFPQQFEFITDRCRLKSARCPRRAGKTYACASLLTVTAIKRPKASIVYLCLTRGQARENLWAYLKDFNEEFELDCKFHETNLWMTFPNGSRVALGGAETEQEIEKLRGGAKGFDLVVVDECKSFSIRAFKYLIWEVLRPALSDKQGTLALIGTPGNVLKGNFYYATTAGAHTDPLDGSTVKTRNWASRENWNGPFTWSTHYWHTKHNTAMPHIWEGALADKEERGITDDNPVWLREWMGEWCPSESLNVYRPQRGKSFWNAEHPGPHGLPDGHDWKYLLGVDIGFRDATALVVAAYAETYPNLMHVYDYKQPELNVDTLEKAVKDTIAKFGEFESMIIDTGGLGKMVMETLNSRGAHFEAAEKREKYDHIELVNTDLLSGRIKILENSYLADEMEVLQWTSEEYKKEDKSTPNHACDAFLYLWRYAYNHFWSPQQIEIKKGSKEYFEKLDDEAAEAVVARRSAEQELDNTLDHIRLDDEWNW